MLRDAAQRAQDKFITVASTTSTEQSGLFKHLLPVFEKKTGIQVRVVALGTGQALDLARRGDADVVFVHDEPAEENSSRKASASSACPVMYNDFVLVGPKTDPAKVAGGKDIARRAAEDRRRRRRRSCRAATTAARTSPSSSYWKAAGIDIAKEEGRVVSRHRASGMGPRSTPRRR